MAAKAFGTVQHMHQSAPAKIEKMPGAAFNGEKPKGGMGRSPLPGTGAKSVTMSKTKDFEISCGTGKGPGSSFIKGAKSNTTGRALSTSMIGPGGEAKHVARISRETDRGAGMVESPEFKKTISGATE